MTAEAIDHELQARRSPGSTTWMARCPAHDDRNPSLAIREEHGKVLLHCHAGCSQRAVLDALQGLGLWGDQSSTPFQSPRQNVKPAVRKSPTPKKPAADLGTAIATYEYTDEYGEVLYRICRYEPKTFRGQRPDGRGGWIKGLGDVRRVLYHLPEVLQAPIVFVVEGEKDVETLRAHGFAATTNAFGATPWLPEFSETLRGREVILIPDNDEPGKNRILAIARSLLGQAASIVVWAPEGAKDISDWFRDGHSELELIAQVEGEAVSQ